MAQKTRLKASSKATKPKPKAAKPKASAKPKPKAAQPKSPAKPKGAPRPRQGEGVVAAPEPTRRLLIIEEAPKSKASVRTTLSAREIDRIKSALEHQRDRLTGQITQLSNDALRYVDDSSSEDRTDDFDREFALNLVSSEHDAVFEINEALHRIEEGRYGRCEMCDCAIEKPRLQALPMARHCVDCQSNHERGRARFRPFGEALQTAPVRGAEASEDEDDEE